MPTLELSPIKPNNTVHLKMKKTYRKEEVEKTLLEKDTEIKYLKGTMMQQQAVLVLQNLYTRKVRQQLHTKEEKGKKKANQKLTHDGLGKVLTMPELIEEAEALEKAQEDAAQEKEDRRQGRLEHATRMTEWKVQMEERDTENERRRNLLKEAVQEWEEARVAAKRAKQVLKQWEKKNPKPLQKWPQFTRLPAIPKPKATSNQVVDDDGEHIDVENVVDSDEDVKDDDD
ncbi:hypothetical protein FA15DRAFT_711761 [Coprinopsis marcescibilis]|uniref:Uncharacterized protein n=1 Tax=Coprinopsis marcescibilis TaxID=230819 RepID=A0A5C3K993_COPMA|nr:hypothetical protein FA15DRAFT_711761 [Coprinopsis marcescibilis]